MQQQSRAVVIHRGLCPQRSCRVPLPRAAQIRVKNPGGRQRRFPRKNRRFRRTAPPRPISRVANQRLASSRSASMVDFGFFSSQSKKRGIGNTKIQAPTDTITGPQKNTHGTGHRRAHRARNPRRTVQKNGGPLCRRAHRFPHTHQWIRAHQKPALLAATAPGGKNGQSSVEPAPDSFGVDRPRDDPAPRWPRTFPGTSRARPPLPHAAHVGHHEVERIHGLHRRAAQSRHSGYHSARHVAPRVMPECQRHSGCPVVLGDNQTLPDVPSPASDDPAARPRPPRPRAGWPDSPPDRTGPCSRVRLPGSPRKPGPG